ncbi:uncharacterized protein Dvir_GJ26125, isoform C [Drosophila virilis]|uniref:Uncharacterized protein, isoform C n=1 Tax=Drosophila virilis TaxID=7244 RepID=A0A0Q9WKQ7_DROVI|nr:uncharacterized protein Dvir_GJ26125, isoform C [Drosophila virilis]
MHDEKKAKENSKKSKQKLSRSGANSKARDCFKCASPEGFSMDLSRLPCKTIIIRYVL